MLLNEVERKSLCKVHYDYDGKKWLSRLGDIEKGVITRFTCNEELPKVFDNRTRLFCKDGPDDEGTVGIWDWTAIPRDTDNEKDFVTATYSINEQPIEVYEISSVNSDDALIAALKGGLIYQPSCENVIFCYKTSNKFFSGILCGTSVLDVDGNKVEFSDNVTTLPLCDFTVEDVIRFSDRAFMRNLNTKISARKIMIKAPVAIVREAVLRRSSWSAMKNRGITRNDWKQYRDFLGDISDDSLYSDIAMNCECSIEEAKSYVDEFVKSAEHYITADDVNIDILSVVIEKNEELKKECERIVASKWENEHQDIVDDKKKEIEKANEELRKIQRELEKKSDEINKRKTELESIEKEIVKNRKLGDEIENKVAKKIEEAKSDMAEFLSSQVFYGSGNRGTTDSISTSTPAFINGKARNEGESDDWENALDSVEDELVEAGVASEYRRSLAAYLYSAYVNRISVLLAGPSAEDIGNAFSIGAFGREAGRLDCSVGFEESEIENMLSGDDDVVIIKSPFSSGWVSSIMDLCSRHKKFYFLTVPFAEDVLIEPKGLFSYVLPMITDLFIDDVPKRDYVGRKRSDTYKEYASVKAKNEQEASLRALHLTMLAKKKIQSVLTDMHNMEKNASVKEDYSFMLVPYAYFTDQIDQIAEIIESEDKLTNQTKEILKGYLEIDK